MHLKRREITIKTILILIKRSEKEDAYSHILFLCHTNLIPYYSCNLWWKPLADHSLKHSLETQRCEQLLKLNAPIFAIKGCADANTLILTLLRYKWMKMLVESLRDRAVLRCAVRAKGSVFFFFFFFFMYGNTERAQCALSRVCIP